MVVPATHVDVSHVVHDDSAGHIEAAVEQHVLAALPVRSLQHTEEIVGVAAVCDALNEAHRHRITVSVTQQPLQFRGTCVKSNQSLTVLSFSRFYKAPRTRGVWSSPAGLGKNN